MINIYFFIFGIYIFFSSNYVPNICKVLFEFSVVNQDSLIAYAVVNRRHATCAVCHMYLLAVWDACVVD